MKKIVAFLLAMVMVACSSFALADSEKSKQIYSTIPIYNENDTAYDVRTENNDTLYYQFSSNTSCTCRMRVGSVTSTSVSGGKATVNFSSKHSEKGYCPSWSNTISYSGSVNYTSSTTVKK